MPTPGIRVNVDLASSMKAHQFAPENWLHYDPASSIRVNPGRYASLWAALVQQDLAAYYPTASAGAVDLVDYVGTNDLTNNGGATRGDGPSANLPDAVSLSRASSQYPSATGAPLLPGDQPFGGAAWLWRSTQATDGFSSAIGFPLSGQRAWWIDRITSSSRLAFRASADGTATTSIGTSTDVAVLPTETWGFVAWWWTGTTIHIQLNMGAIGSTAFAGPIHPSTEDFRIGHPLTALRWDGRIVALPLWMGRIPTQAELAWLYNGGAGRDLLPFLGA